MKYGLYANISNEALRVLTEYQKSRGIDAPAKALEKLLKEFGDDEELEKWLKHAPNKRDEETKQTLKKSKC